ncbi:flagellar protein FlgN [Cohnella nanjingensis]|uniref:Flagellar protein FlgN n=1 Tax=Cohnella nanjingensis TaxID=1387779 RepID=A0A7X0RPY8_9BACL|nr:flagellar protein FlgN [Cohnella nanjingensis]MBB6671523.1 flagellar protein FlgN [Cohnella nanjingensis]
MSIQGLLTTLEALTDIHEEMLQLARDKVRIVVENKVEDLVALTAKETRVVSRLESCYRDMTQETAGGWAELGLAPRPSVKLSDLIQAVHRADRKSELTELALKLRSQHEELKVLNERNQMLVRQSLDYIQFELDLIAGPYDQDVTYSPNAGQSNYQGGTSRRMFDTRA